MNQINKNYSLEEILRDTKHNKKAKEVFLKLYAKQKKPKNPFDEVRSYTLPITKEIKPGADDV
ncbi:MAG: hypothetical protein KJO12_01745 [Ignavibacteria bacterium]|nr:hypothetical protein [Ignavibacteria bacterium]NNJ54105.1 hypothetical protein [Ignavibacteriaceae bacterium]